MKIELSGHDEIARHLDATPTDVVKATVRALNRALSMGATQIARLVSTDTGIKVSDVKKRIYTVEASYERPDGKVATRSLKRIPLMAFQAKGVEPSRGIGRPVTAKVDGARKAYVGSFLANVQYFSNTDFGREYGLHKGVFVRESGAKGGKRQSPKGWSKNLPIRQLYGPSLGRVFAKYRPQVVAFMGEKFSAEIERQLQRTDANV